MTHFKHIIDLNRREKHRLCSIFITTVQIPFQYLCQNITLSPYNNHAPSISHLNRVYATHNNNKNEHWMLYVVYGKIIERKFSQRILEICWGGRIYPACTVIQFLYILIFHPGPWQCETRVFCVYVNYVIEFEHQKNDAISFVYETRIRIGEALYCNH